MYIPHLREMLDKFWIPISISFSINTDDVFIENLLYDKALHNILYKRCVENLRKKIRSDYYQIFVIRYAEHIEYEIEGSMMIEWLNVSKITEVDYDINVAYHKCDRHLAEHENFLKSLNSTRTI
jgi:hypothetical protein